MNLKGAVKENPTVLYDLVQKCKNAQYQFPSTPFGDSKSILTQYRLLEPNGEVRDDIKKIVLNSVEGSGVFAKLVNPLKPEQVSVIKEKVSRL